VVLDDQMLWDGYNDVFERIVDLADSILQTTAFWDGSNGTTSGDNSPSSPMTRGSLSPSASPLFTLDGGIVGPLYDISRRCRDPRIRRRAIHLLYTYPRQEGMWDGVLAARVAERVVAIEEGGVVGGPVLASSADVPDWARISEVNPIFDLEGRKAVLCYARRGDAFSEVRIPCQEVIEWE